MFPEKCDFGKLRNQGKLRSISMGGKNHVKEWPFERFSSGKICEISTEKVQLCYFCIHSTNWSFLRLNIAQMVSTSHEIFRLMDWDWSLFYLISQFYAIAIFWTFYILLLIGQEEYSPISSSSSPFYSSKRTPSQGNDPFRSFITKKKKLSYKCLRKL